MSSTGLITFSALTIIMTRMVNHHFNSDLVTLLTILDRLRNSNNVINESGMTKRQRVTLDIHCNPFSIMALKP